MGNLIVRPSYQLTETDILTVDKLNLLGTPQVSLSLESPVNDQNYWRNGNFYSSFWTTPAGVSCPVGVETQNADYWLVNPSGGPVSAQRSIDVPDVYSLFSLQLVGAANVTDCSVGQQINADLSAVLRRACTVSGYIENNSGSNLSATFEVWTANAFNDFTNVTLQETVNLQTAANAAWTYVSATVDLTSVTNVANGLFLKIRLPNGALSATTKTVNFSRLKFQIGEIATEFVDDASLFIQTPSVDSTMLQDGCIARSGLFLPNVVPTGAYQAKSINSGDINDGAVDGRCLKSDAVATSLGYTPVNKGGDTGIGQLGYTNDDVVGTAAVTGAGIIVTTTAANQANAGYMPAISFNRPTVCGLAVGLTIDGYLQTVDQTGKSGWLLDTVHGVDTASYQDKSITLAKLAQSLIDVLIPAGMVRMFGGPNIPPGWLACDGSAYSRVTYPALYGAIGTYWGAGDNISTFNVPDLRGRSPLGYVNSPITGITSRAFASNGGEENHVLTTAETAAHVHSVPAHGHGFNPGSHQHTLTGIGYYSYGFASGALSADWLARGGTSYGPAVTPSAATGASVVDAAAFNTTSNGSNGGHNNMSPFAVLYYIIKT